MVFGGRCTPSVISRGCTLLQEVSIQGKSTGHGKPFDILSLGPLVPVDTGAFFILGKLFLCCGLVTVDLPAAHTFAGAVFQKAAYILRRITQKQADLMGELLFQPKLFRKLAHAFFTAAGAVAPLLKNVCRPGIGQVCGQFSGAIDIDQCLFLRKPKGKNAKPLADQLGVCPPDKGEELFPVPAGTGEQICGFDPCQGGGSVPDQVFF